MHPDRFRPAATLTPDHIGMLFTKDTPFINMYTKESPDELHPAGNVVKSKIADGK
jgi:hypothetical protein